jgi:hypothetical protein
MHLTLHLHISLWDYKGLAVVVVPGHTTTDYWLVMGNCCEVALSFSS